MRPIQLVISAFGPYAGEQIVDFRKLGMRNFFLIHGPTGGGKTAILDAICYALYGDTSGHERTGEQMRSHLAQSTTPTSVSFDVSLGQKAYRVTRNPEQQRPRKRGEGTTIDVPKAVLWDRTALADDAQEGTVLAAQPTKVTEQVEKLLGFRSEQFRQVIMLPQEKFRELLTADSRQREQILETLFQTGFYGRIQEALKAKAREVEQKVNEVRQRQMLLLQQAEAASLSELQERRTTQDGIVKALEATIAKLRSAEAEAQARLTGAIQTEAKFQEQKLADAALRELQVKAREYEQNRQAVVAAKRAASIAPDETALGQRQREAKTRQDVFTAAQVALSVAQSAIEAASRTLQVQEDLQPEAEKLRDTIARLNSLGEQVERLEGAQGQFASAEQRSKDLQVQHRSAQAIFDTLQKQIQEQQSRLASAQQVAAGHEGHTLAVEQAKTKLQDRRKLETIRRQRPRQEGDHKDLDQQVQTGLAILQQARLDLAALRNAWSCGQAAILAQGLLEGQPCPVCGSAEHPKPAAARRPLPSRDEIDRTQREIEGQEKGHIALREQAQAAATALALAQASESALVEALGDLASEPTSNLERRLQEALGTLKTAQAAKNELAGLAEQITKTQATSQQQKIALANLAGQGQDAADELIKLRTVRDQSLQGVPEHLRTQAALTAAKAAATTQLQQIEDGIKAARLAATQAETTLAGARAESARAKLEAEQAAEALAACRREFEAKRQQAGFSGDSEYKAAKLAEVQVRRFEEQIRQYDQWLSAATDRAQRAAQAADGLTPPDMAAVRNALTIAKDKLEAAIGQKGNLEREIAQIDRWAATLAEAASMQRDLEKNYSVIGRVSEVAWGKNRAGLTFQRFVLTFLLDDVLVAATDRLRIMSKGRYHLQRRCERGDQRVHSGLDLEVFDTYTGTTRLVATLSGGESFLASLSLALGLADVVQAYAGGIRLETMFIDEGFGSLDSESLDLAVRSLVDLLKDGRLVGIISHVPELRERIDARLEVTSGRSGSTAQFVLS